jgi:UMF1 family MFS transporter
MAAIYGTSLGIPDGDLIGAILLVQFVGVPFAFLFGALAARFGAKPCVLFCIVSYFAIVAFAYQMQTATEFYVLALGVAMVQGGAQALSRSLFSSLIPRQRSGEFFGLFAVGEKFAGIFGPALFTLAERMSGESRGAILSLLLFFGVGGALLVRVNVRAGQAAAREAEARIERETRAA